MTNAFLAGILLILIYIRLYLGDTQVTSFTSMIKQTNLYHYQQVREILLNATAASNMSVRQITRKYPQHFVFTLIKPIAIFNFMFTLQQHIQRTHKVESRKMIRVGTKLKLKQSERIRIVTERKPKGLNTTV